MAIEKFPRHRLIHLVYIHICFIFTVTFDEYMAFRKYTSVPSLKPIIQLSFISSMLPNIFYWSLI